MTDGTAILPALSRRAMLAATGCMVAAAGLPLYAKPPLRRIERVGLQLYTVRDLFAPDPLGTLERVAEIGYREVEFGGGGFEAMDHAKLRQQMDRLGLTAPSMHVPLGLLDQYPDLVFDTARTVGATLIVVPYVDADRRGADAWNDVISILNRRGADAAKAGLQLAYHNHDFEFTDHHGGRNLFDILLAERDPAVVAIELDIFWAVHAGQDPIALIHRLPGQIRAYHVKDRAADGAMIDVGQGVIDFAAIFALNDFAGVQHFFVEHDRAPPPFLPSITTSFKAVDALRF